MKKHYLLFTALTMTLILCFFAISPRAKGEKELILGVALNPMIRNTSIAGKGTADMRELAQTVADEFEKLYGYTVTLKIYPSPKFFLKGIQNGAVDFTMGTLASYLHAKNTGLPITPFVTTSTSGTKGEKRCLWVHKDSGIKNIKQLQGKRFVHDFPLFMSKKDALPPKGSYIYWIMVKKILLQNGVNKPFTEFFKEFRVLPTASESIAYSVLLKKFDAFCETTNMLENLIKYDKGFSDLIPLSCIDVVMPPMTYRKDLDIEVVKTMKNYFLFPPKGSAMEKMIKKEFKRAKIYPVEEKDYDIYLKWLKEAEQKGWFKEFDEIMAKVMKEFKEKRKSKYIYEGEK